MVNENQLQQHIARKQEWLENELSQRPRFPQLGDIFVFIYPDDEIGLQWIIVDQDKKKSQFFIVPADDTPMVGSMDIDLPDSALCSPLTLRCDLGLWIDAKYFDLELRVGVLEEWHRRRALERAKQISDKKFTIQCQKNLITFLKFWHKKLPKMVYRLVGNITSVGSVLYQEMNYEPAYVDFKQQVSREQRALRRMLSPKKKLITPISEKSLGLTWKVGWAMAIVLLLAVSLKFFLPLLENQQIELTETDNNLIVQYYQEGQYQKALPLAEKAFKIRTDVLGEKHPDTLTSLNNLAMIYQELGRLDEALPLYKKFYHSSTEVLGEEHPNTLTSLNNLAMVYQELGHLDEALYEKSYRLSTEVLGEKHPDTLTSLNNLAMVYQKLGRLDEVLFLYEKSYRLSINKTDDLEEELRDFKFRWENRHPNILAFSSEGGPPLPAAKAFGAGLLTGRESLLGKHEIILPPPLLPQPSLESWLKTEWASHFQLGRWTFLLWTASQFPDEMPETFWDQQRAILAQLKVGFQAQTDDAKEVMFQLENQQIEQLLNKLPTSDEPEIYDDLGSNLEKVMSFLAPPPMEKRQ